MEVTCYGAAGEVTGSCFHLRTKQADVLIDCGLFQSGDDATQKNIIPDSIAGKRLDGVVLTHAHLDHVGRLPLLVKTGYDRPIYGTSATLELVELVLTDAAKVQAQDTLRLNRRLERAGRPLQTPLFTMEDVARVVQLLRPLDYRHPVNIAEGVTVSLREAGHILGSASVEVRAEGRTVVFSGDIGPRNLPLLKDPEPYECADGVFMESTYGDRDHKPIEVTTEEFKNIVLSTLTRRGKVLVPSFAVGRTQQLLYYLAELMVSEQLEGVPIFVDSPMAARATDIYQRHAYLFDECTQRLTDLGAVDALWKQVQFTQTPEESMAINHVEGPAIIIAGSGMCQAGRILHHLKHHLWREETSVIIVGYQVKGSLGRRLVDGEKRVRILGEEIAVRASIHTLGGFSAHAGQTELVDWFKKLLPCHPRAVLVHGEAVAREALRESLKSAGAPEVILPELGSRIEF
ncbi:MAG: MBL fold metallo-hydrolase [Methylacidiphilales bacterium]|nr:MBL fold metallo-hydrolase [Candidatus Methylacidiphilales bacterium]MDW8349831.1 MBL fold metallo-hydrolase [Verrucomicrobiae bacterium]